MLILIELGIVAVLAAIFQWLLTLCTNIVTYKTVRDLRSAAFEHMEELPLSNIDSRPHGDIISRIINDIDSVSDGLLQGFSQLFTGIITIAITLVYMLAINFKVGLVVVVITPLSLFVASFIAKHSFDMFRRQSAIKGQLSGCSVCNSTLPETVSAVMSQVSSPPEIKRSVSRSPLTVLKSSV